MRCLDQHLAGQPLTIRESLLIRAKSVALCQGKKSRGKLRKIKNPAFWAGFSRSSSYFSFCFSAMFAP